MRTIFRRAAVALAIVVVGIQVIRPARMNPLSETSLAAAAVGPIPARAAAVFDRACRDCHSNETQWPWYSNVAPVSWFVIDHVNHGRSHFNYSEWNRYTPDEATRLLKNGCELAREGRMPLASYTWMHPEARLSEADVDALCAWRNHD